MIIDFNDHSPRPNLTKPPNLPPIFIETELNINNFMAKIDHLTRSTGFECKSYIKDLELQIISAPFSMTLQASPTISRKILSVVKSSRTISHKAMIS